MEIVTDVHKDAKQLTDLLDLFSLSPYLDDTNAIVSPKHKSNNKNDNKKPE